MLSQPTLATDYDTYALAEVARWRGRMLRAPSKLDKAARGMQVRINKAIPEPVHVVITTVMERMIRTVLYGADVTTAAPLVGVTLRERDERANRTIDNYRNAAAVEGGVAGAGGFWLAAADFPVFMTIKLKLLFELAAIYGRSADDFAERLFILHIFQLAFSGAEHRADVFRRIEAWDAQDHPPSFEDFDWRRFQQEYRDYIDLAKLAQLIPVIGAPVGVVVNWRLTQRLGDLAVNAYRQRALRERASATQIADA